MLGLARKVQAALGGEKFPPITLEPGARVWDPEPVKEIILLGMGASCIQLIADVYSCEFEEKGKREVWAINHSAFLLRHTLAHNMGDLTDPNRMAGPAHSFIDLYRDHPQPLVTTRYVKEIKKCYEFPWELVFNTWNDYYFQTGPALTLALAMISAERYRHKTGQRPTIRLYGFEYNYPGRHGYEEGRCCMEYWVGRAKQAGFNILVPDSTSLLDQSSYSMGNKVGLHGNGFCYGLGKARPVFGMDEGKLYLKAFKNLTEDASVASDDPGPDLGGDPSNNKISNPNTTLHAPAATLGGPPEGLPGIAAAADVNRGFADSMELAL